MRTNTKPPKFLKSKKLSKLPKLPVVQGPPAPRNMLDEAIKEGSHGAKLFQATRESLGKQ